MAGGGYGDGSPPPRRRSLGRVLRAYLAAVAINVVATTAAADGRLLSRPPVVRDAPGSGEPFDERELVTPGVVLTVPMVVAAGAASRSAAGGSPARG